MGLPALLLLVGCPNPECPTGTHFEHGACVEDPTTPTGTTGETGREDTGGTLHHSAVEHTGIPTRPTPTGPSMLRSDEGRSGYAPGPAPATGALLWGAPIGPVCQVPILRDRVAYVVSDRTLFALDTIDHTVAWTFRADAVIVASPAVDDEIVVFGDRLGGIYALDTDGDELWRAAGPSACSSPAIGDDGVWFSCGAIALLDRSTGAIVRSVFAPNLDPEQAPTLTSELVIAGKQPMRAWSRATLDLAWQVDLGRSTATSPATDLFAWASTSNGTFQVGTNQGGVVWAVDNTAAVGKSSPALGGGVVYVGTTRGVRARDAETGVERWTTQLPAPTKGGLVLAGDGLFVADDLGNVHALARSDGALRWSVDAGACAGPALDGGLLYVGTQEGLAVLQ
ncbi:MAG: PQQ-binding-like beta-propeller repeat protein [Alphaproteobacteria bacterium]|nr:PQQ-binding-like beta-propeller repeat protein [Alphaproteobacteria bacterium]